ncbi:hypothetical protein MHYP_G00300180 [Metynnis hypsauchen]
MSSECGMLLIILLRISGCLGESVSVSCSPQPICALQESAVNLICSYPNIAIKTVFWFSFKQKAKWRNEGHPEDLALDSDYAGRVSTESTDSKSTLTIRELRERDSGEYHVMIITEQGEKHLNPRAVSLTVTALQVRVISSTASDDHTVTLMCSSTCSLSNNPTYIWYKNGQPVTNKLTRDNKLYLNCSEDAGNYSCAVRGHEELRSPDQTLSDCAENPEQSSVLTLVTVGVVVFLALILITAALWMCCVIRRKRGAERDTDFQTPDPTDHTYTALNPTTLTSDYDTLTHLTDSPSDTYTGLNPETMCSDYNTLTGMQALQSELQRRASAADYENVQRPSA